MNTEKLIAEAFTILNEVESLSSTNDKKEALSTGKDNYVLKVLLRAAYDPFITYNIRKIPVIERHNESDPDLCRYTDFLSLLSDFSDRKITGNDAILSLTIFLESLNYEEYKWYTRVIERDLKIGLAEKGINSVFKDLIPTYEVLLADKIPADSLNLDTPKALKMLPDEFVTQYKIDGYRLNIHVLDDGEVLIRTRNGKFVEGYNELESEAKEKLPKGYVYDGEVVAPELFAWIRGNIEAGGQTEANRDLFAEVMSHAFSKEENKKGIFNLFDMVPVKEWNTRKTTQAYSKRLDNIDKLIKPLDLKTITIVPTSRVYHKNNRADLEEVIESFHSFINVGWEGIMIKNTKSTYEFKRSKNLLKMKLMDTIDLTVIDVYEGTGKYKGMLGGVTCDYKGYELGVGSGWSDEQRVAYWQNKNAIIGKTIEIAYQAETKNKKGELSVSFPVVKSVRFDK